MKVLLLHNPSAGDGRHDARALQALVERAGHEVCHRSDDDERWADALDASVGLVAIAGGDGTVGDVARVLLRRASPPPLTLLPLGTANNVAHALGATDAPAALVARWRDAPLRSLDLWRASAVPAIGDAPCERVLLEAFGVGLAARAMADVQAMDDDARHARQQTLRSPLEPKLALGLHALRDRLRTARPHRCRLRLDGVERSGEYLLVEALNVARLGPALALAPHADPGDGVLDVVVATPADRARLDDALAARLAGAEAAPTLPGWRGRVLELAWDAELTAHADDERWSGPPSVTVEPAGRLRVLDVRRPAAG